MADSALAAMVAAQNSLAINNSASDSRPHTLVRVLQTARYNGPDHKAKQAKTGDIIAVAPGRYAQDLVATDMVELYVAELPEEEPPEQDDVDLATLKVAELREMAATFGIETEGMKKADIIAALQA